MSQQINLFNPVFLKQKKYFSALTMLQGLGLILLGALAVMVYARLQTTVLGRSAQESAAQLKLTSAQLARVSAEYAPRKPDAMLEDEGRRLEAEVRSQQQALDLVKRGGFGDRRGYSDYLKAFSRQIVGGLWLTGFTIRGGEIELRGRALTPDLVPTYISRLRQEPVMQGKSFTALSMGAPASEPGQPAAAEPAAERPAAAFIEFTLSSATGEGAAAAGASKR